MVSIPLPHRDRVLEPEGMAGMTGELDTSEVPKVTVKNLNCP